MSWECHAGKQNLTLKMLPPKDFHDMSRQHRPETTDLKGTRRMEPTLRIPLEPHRVLVVVTVHKVRDPEIVLHETPGSGEHIDNTA